MKNVRRWGRVAIYPVVIAALAGGGLAVGHLAAASPEPGSSAAPAVADGAVPRMAQDVGTGEQLLLVIGGAYATRAEADAANAAMSFGDVQGYYVVPFGQFRGLAQYVPTGGKWILASAFRTSEGANAFLELARAVGAPATVTPRVVSLGGAFAGLGQEPDPNGQGPLTHAIPASGQ